MMGSAALAYRISYFDCLNPKDVKEMDASKVCKNNNDNKMSKRRYAVLQQLENRIIKGFKCKISRSKWTFYCGAFSNEKLISIPEIEIGIPVTNMECSTMITTHKFTTLYGTHMM